MNGLANNNDDSVECPLCMEPLEVDDLTFFPCTCGYQVSSTSIEIETFSKCRQIHYRFVDSAGTEFVRMKINCAQHVERSIQRIQLTLSL